MKVMNRHSEGSFLVSTLTIQLLLCWCGVHTTDSAKNCKLLKDSESEQKVLNRLEPLAHRNFTVQTSGETETYTYVFQFCGDAWGVPGAGVVQLDDKTKEKRPKTIGAYNATQAYGGTDWVMLIYGDGEKYDAHCSGENRRAIIMISCDRNMDVGRLGSVLEDREREQGCFYLFELDSSAVCPPLESKLSPGSIILIIGVCIVSVYLIGGFLYQRLIVGAKGMEQFPNYYFWLEVGNLSADGCDFVCRSRSREEAPAYRGVATEPLEEEPEERDDHLLPM